MLDVKKLIAKVLAMMYKHKTALSNIGDIVIGYASSAVSVPTATGKTLCSVVLPKGVWVVRCHVRWPAQNGGVRRASFSTAANGADIYVQDIASAAQIIEQSFTEIVSSSGATYYLNGYQNSGSTISVSAGNAGGYVTGIRAVRIA